jgi:hypothetical protein
MKRPDYKSTKDRLIAVPLPQQTSSYKPIANEQLIDLTLNSLQGAGFQLENEMYSMSSDGQMANGKFTIRNVADTEMQLQIGWQNSYNKQLSLKFAIGAYVFICSNGCVHGDMGSFKKKHVGEIQEFTPTAITDYIKRAGETFQKIQTEREMMKQIELTKRTKAELIGRMLLEEELITTLQVNEITKELTSPTYDYNAPDSMWELYQFTTQTMRSMHPRSYISAHINVHNFFVNKSGLLVTPEEQEFISPVAMAQSIMMMAGDSEEDINNFRQITMEF